MEPLLDTLVGESNLTHLEKQASIYQNLWRSFGFFRTNWQNAKLKSNRKVKILIYVLAVIFKRWKNDFTKNENKKSLIKFKIAVAVSCRRKRKSINFIRVTSDSNPIMFSWFHEPLALLKITDEDVNKLSWFVFSRLFIFRIFQDKMIPQSRYRRFLMFVARFC